MLAARREKQEAEATALAAAAQMTDAIKSASADAGAVKKAAARELERAKEAADGRMREYVDKFREQVGAPIRQAGGEAGCLEGVGAQVQGAGGCAHLMDDAGRRSVLGGEGDAYVSAPIRKEGGGEP